MTETIVQKGVGYEMLVRTPDHQNFQRFADARISSLRDFTIPLDEFGKYLVEVHIPQQFSSEGAPAAWVPLSPDYAEYKESVVPGMPLLVFSGAMKRGFGWRATRFSLKITNPKDYWKHHQTGTRIMPARKLIQLTDADYKNLRQDMREYIVNAVPERFA